MAQPRKIINSNVRPADVSRKKPRDAPDELAQRDEAAGRSLRRGLQVLDAVLNSGQEGVRVIDLCRICGLQRAPVYRLLTTLIECGYVQQQGRFRYVAGPQVGTLVPPGGESDLAARLQPVLARISSACGDAAFAVVRDGSLSHCIARQIGTHPVQILAVEVGTRQPLGVGAAGLALLSALPPDEADAVTRASSEALARFGGMTSARMDLLVRATRERGWSVVGNHAVKGAMGVGMALCAPDGTPIAGISVAAAMGRMPKERQQLIAGLIRKALAALPPKLR